MENFKIEDITQIKEIAKKKEWDLLDTLKANQLIFTKGKTKKPNTITIWAKKKEPYYTISTLITSNTGQREQKFFYQVKPNEFETYFI